MKEFKPKIQYSYKEYVRSVSDLLSHFYFNTLEDISFEDSHSSQLFDSKLFVFLVTSFVLYSEHEGRLTKKVIKEIEQDIVDNFIHEISKDEVFKMTWNIYYQNFSKILKQVLVESSKNVSNDAHLLGISRILLEGITLKKEDYINKVELVKNHIQEAMFALLKLAENTGYSPKLIGKSAFMVLRD